MAPLPLANGSSLQAQQWRCAVRHTPPRLAASGSPGYSSAPMVAQQTLGSTSVPSSVPFGVMPGSANARLVSPVNTMGATCRGTSAPIAGNMLADPLERQTSRNSLKGGIHGGITPQGGATPHGGATPIGGTPRCRSRPHAPEGSTSPSRSIPGVHVVTSAAWRVASPRQMADGTPPAMSPGSTAQSNGGPAAPRPRSVGERPHERVNPHERGGKLNSSRRLESPQVSIAHFESPQASPVVSARGGFSCRAAPPTHAIRLSGDSEASEAMRIRRPPVGTSSTQHPMSIPYQHQQGSRYSSGSHSHPVVPIHERIRSQTPPHPHGTGNSAIEVAGSLIYRDGVGVASSPAVSSTADPSCSFEACTRSSGSLLHSVSRSAQPEARRHGSWVAAPPSSMLNNSSVNHASWVAAPPGSMLNNSSVNHGSWVAAPPGSMLNSSSCNSPFGTSSLGSCPVLHLEESGAFNAALSEPSATSTAVPSAVPSAISTGAPPTPTPSPPCEDVPPWRSDCRPGKQETGHHQGIFQGSDEEYEDGDEDMDNADGNPGLLNDIGWTPSFHSLAVASPGVASISSPLSAAVSPPEPPHSLRQPPTNATGPSAEEETARAMVMDIEAEAARAVRENYATAETVPKLVMKWDGKDWVPITPTSPEKASGGISEIEADRALEELRSSANFEAAERRRLEVLHSRAAEHIADCERRIASLQGSLVEANSQRDDYQRQLKEKSEKHTELVKRFRRHQEANKRLEEDLSRAAEIRNRLEKQAKQERLGKVAAEQMAKELQQKVQDFEKEVTAVAQVDSTEKVSADLEEQLEKLRRQLEETVRTVQLRCGPGSASGDLSKAAAVAAAATRGLTGPRHLSPSTLQLLEATVNIDTQPSNKLLGNGSAAWTNCNASTALSTEEELPTTEEQLLGEWSSTSLQESQHDRGSGEVGRLTDVDEELDMPGSVIRLMGGSSAESLGGVSIGSVHSGAPPSEIDEGDGTVVLPLRQTSEDTKLTHLTAAEFSHLREPAPSPSSQSDDGLLSFETIGPVRAISCNSQSAISLSLRDLSEIKALKKPPPPIRMLMEVCCLLFHIQPVKQADERNAKKYKLDYWEPARRYLLSDPFFLSKLRMYESDEISSSQRAKIKKYFQDPDFTAERIKNCSKAAHELYEWVSRLVQPEAGFIVTEVRRTPQMTSSSRRRESPPCARTPPPTSASGTAR